MHTRLKKIVSAIDSVPLSFAAWIGTFSSLIVIRLLVELWLGSMGNRDGRFVFYEFSHTFLFFLFAYLLVSFTVHFLTGITFRKILTALLFGHLIIITPPLVDNFFSGGQGFWSFYKFDGLAGLTHRFLTFFGDRPDIGITYGVRFEVAMAVLAIFIYSSIRLSEQLGKWKSVIKALWVATVAYLVLFILGTFPSWISILLHGPAKGFLNVNELDIAQDFLSPPTIFSQASFDITRSLNTKMSFVYALAVSAIVLVWLFAYQRKKFLAFLRNFRFPQVIYHSGLFILGLGMGLVIDKAVWKIDFWNIVFCLTALEAILLAWLASVIVNDLADQDIDRLTNPGRPLNNADFSETEYQLLGWVLFGASLFLGAIFSVKMGLLLLAYQALAFGYSAWPLRLKRFPIIATFVSSIASILILLAGYLISSPQQSLANFPLVIGVLLIVSYTLSIPLKDFKDIAGDRADGVYTLPVVFGETWGKLIVSSGVFLSFFLSVVLLNEPRLMWWAILGGSASFWIINKMEGPENKRIFHYRNIFWWIMGIVGAYGLILTKIIFF